jgi:DNA-binding transcriptional MocR family regulator
MQADDGVRGQRASDISVSIEEAIREGRLSPGAQLPTVRALAERLDVSPSTVSAAYRYLRQRGVISTHGRGGTRVHSRPPVGAPSQAADRQSDAGLRRVGVAPVDTELAQINRDALMEIVDRRELDDEGQLERRLAKDLDANGVDATSVVAFRSGREALTRVLESHLLPGDRVGIEAPTCTEIRDVLSLNGLEALSIQLDAEGPTPRSFGAVLPRVKAVIVTPRAQDPTGCAIDAARASELRTLARAKPDVLVIEWDPEGDLAGVPLEPVADPALALWAHIRSYRNLFADQTDLAALAGDPTTTSRAKGRQVLSGTELTLIERRLALNVLDHPGTPHRTDGVSRHLASRRVMLMAALRHRGIDSQGVAGSHLWIPTLDQAKAVNGMRRLGWSVTPGDRPDTHSAQGVRVAVDTLDATSAGRFADDLLEVLADL